MVGDNFSSSPKRNRKGKRAGRRARGLAVVIQNGFYHCHGTIRTSGRSIRVRRSLGIPAETALYDVAWDEVRAIEKDIRAEANGESPRGDPVAVAARSYLNFVRVRPLAPTTVRIVKDIVRRFGPRRLNDISTSEWKQWITERHTGNRAQTRERYLNCVMAFQQFARRHHNLKDLTIFERDKEARNPRRRARRRVEDLRPELIGRLFDAAHISLRAQLAVEWSTGARVSSVLYGVRVCDVVLAKGRETIIFHNTKNGDDVVAALHPSAATILEEYAAWRGHLQDREGLFFWGYNRAPYKDNGRSGGGQNKAAFNAAKRRARQRIIQEALENARRLSGAGRRSEALETLLGARTDARLLRKITQHWFRHLLATRMRHDLRAAMEQGGWRDERSVLGYIHDVPESRRAVVSAFDDFAANEPRRPARK